MARVKTFTNGGSLLPGDLNSIEDDYEFAFSTYKHVESRAAASLTAPGAGTYVLSNGLGPTGGNWGAVPIDALAAFYFDPADWTGNTRATKLRVRASLVTNAVAPTTTFTVGLYPVASWGGTSGNDSTVAALGAVIAGSTVAFGAPAGGAPAQGNSGDFTAPAAGWYVIAVVNSGAAAAGSIVTVRAVLQLRQV